MPTTTQTCTCGNARCQAGLQRGLPAICRTPLPAVAEQSLALELTYAGLLLRILDRAPEGGFTTVRDLPDLSLEDLAVVLKRYPTAFIDSIADADPELSHLCIDRLGDTGKQVSERYSHVGLLVVGFIRGYVRALVLRDVQTQCERNRDADSIEAGNDHGDTLTAEQLMACELGLGRSLQ